MENHHANMIQSVVEGTIILKCKPFYKKLTWQKFDHVTQNYQISINLPMSFSSIMAHKNNSKIRAATQ